jgi:hypothetical protein
MLFASSRGAFTSMSNAFSKAIALNWDGRSKVAFTIPFSGFSAVVRAAKTAIAAIFSCSFLE